jgi:predicted permease
MMALVGLVLLIACTNVALMILARNAKRQREFAIRIATGARPFRILRQLFTESFLLVSIGTGLGWFLAFAFMRALAAWAKLETGIAPDYRVLYFTLGTASIVALGFSLAPFWRVFQVSIDQTLRNTNQNVNRSGRRVRSGNAAIAFQIAMCFTLLVAAGLTLRTLLNYENQDLGMHAENLLVFDVSPQHLTTGVQTRLFYGRLLDSIKSVPGVEAASLVQWRPGSGWLQSGGIRLDGKQLVKSSGTRAEIYSNSVGPEFFHTMGIPILQGRDIEAADAYGSRKVVAINEEFTRQFLSDGALGHKIDNDFEIIGVVKNSKYRSVTESNMPTIYYPLAQTGMAGQITVEIRTGEKPMALMPEIQRRMHNLDPELGLLNPMSQATQFERSYVTPKLFAHVALVFGALAIVLVSTGLYGVLVYRLERRRAEIGIRMALGALRFRVVQLILKECLGIAAVGLALGVPLSLLVSHLLRSQLYQLSGLDLFSYAAAASMTFTVAILAALVPAHQASRTDPMEAIRSE